jgi:hypothetical protein
MSAAGMAVRRRSVRDTLKDASSADALASFSTSQSHTFTCEKESQHAIDPDWFSAWTAARAGPDDFFCGLKRKVQLRL